MMATRRMPEDRTRISAKPAGQRLKGGGSPSTVTTSPSRAHWEQPPRWEVALGCMIRSLLLCAPFKPYQ